jgi:peroxiredoxin
MPFPVVADPGRRLGAALGLPTFEFDGTTLYRRVTLVLEAGRVARVFYPVFPPDLNAAEVVAWLRKERVA